VQNFVQNTKQPLELGASEVKKFEQGIWANAYKTCESL